MDPKLQGLPASEILLLYSAGYFDTESALAQCLSSVNERILHHRDDISDWLDEYSELQQSVLGKFFIIIKEIVHVILYISHMNQTRILKYI